MKFPSLWPVISGIVVANFGYQLMTTAQWAVAAERTYFQLLAILATWLYAKATGSPQ